MPPGEPTQADAGPRRISGKDRERMARKARKLYMEDRLPIRAVGKRLGGWSYGATHRLLTEYDVPLRGRGSKGQVKPPVRRKADRGSSDA